MEQAKTIQECNLRILLKTDLMLAIILFFVALVQSAYNVYENWEICIVCGLLFSVISAMIGCDKGKNKRVKLHIFTAITIVFVYTFLFVTSLFGEREDLSIAIGLFYILLPILFIVPIHYADAFSIITLALYAVVSNKVMEPEAMLKNITIYIACIIFGTIIGQEVLKSKLSYISDASKFMKTSAQDGLTKINNRKSLDDYVYENFMINLDFAVAMFDIDNFKIYNDTYGHQNGDKVLIEVAAALNRVAKKYNAFVGRYGGEEFLLAACENNAHNMKAITLDCLQEVNSLRIQYKENQYGHVTISGGFSVREIEDSIETIIRRADNALYAAKKAGRNRICTPENIMLLPKNKDS